MQLKAIHKYKISKILEIICSFSIHCVNISTKVDKSECISAYKGKFITF